MAKKIKFPLEMKEGVSVRSLEELRDNFDINKIIEYYFTGKLEKWLDVRNYKYEKELISKLSSSDAMNLNKKLCSILLGINLDNIICNQRELNNLIEKNEKKIYIFSENFIQSMISSENPIQSMISIKGLFIPTNIKNINFIGITNSIIFFQDACKIVEGCDNEGDKIVYDNEYALVIYNDLENNGVEFENLTLGNNNDYIKNIQELQKSFALFEYIKNFKIN